MRLRQTLAWIVVLCSGALGQATTPENPVYVDDSTTAGDVLLRLDELERQGSLPEAVRAVQQLLTEAGNRVMESGDGDLFRPVRRAVHERLLGDPELLAAYRGAEEAEAQRQLEAGAFEEITQSRFLTPTGFEAALRVAQLQTERAAFHAALLTLAEVESHPDFADRRADAASVLRLLGAYLDPAPEEMMVRWGVDLGGAAVTPPPAENPSVTGPTQPGDSTPLDGIIPRPLSSEDLSPVEEEPLTPDEMQFMNARPLADSTVFGWTLPTVVDDVIYTNDGEHITAWDRFTLRQEWRVRRADPIDDGLFSRRDLRRRQSTRIEDAGEVTIAGDRLLAVTGIAISGTRQGDPRVHCLDRATGEVYWSVDPAALDPVLAEGSIRGPAVCAEGTVVIAVRKWARERRTVSIYLVGLELETGGLRWLRLLGSAGALPFQTAGRFPERMTIHDGVVYRGDEIGVVAGVEVDTGRPRWVRRFDSFRLYDNDVRPAWASSGPVVRGGQIITIEPNRERVVVLDMETGALTDSTPSTRLASPMYLLRSGENLVAIGEHQIAWTPLAEFPGGEVRASDALLSPPVVGRVAAAGGALLIPREGMFTTLDLESRHERTREIDDPGNLLALEGQLLAADDSRLHSYMVWEVASELLQSRLAEDPGNPAPAATLAELAFRAKRFDQIVEPVDRALEVIRAEPGAHDHTRRSLFQSLLAMLDPASADRRAAAEGDAGFPKITDVSLLTALGDRLEALAETPEEMVSHRLVQASLREAVSDIPGSIESLQRILGDRFMADSFWRGGQLTIQADLEASRRVERLLATHGWAAYADFEREAQVQMSLIGAATTAEELHRLAQRYPFSALAPEFWLAAARATDPAHAVGPLLSGVRSLEMLLSLGAPIDAETGGELFGLAIATLVGDGRTDEARRLAEIRAERFADLALIVGGSRVAVEDLLGTSATTADIPARPRIGFVVDTEAQPRLEQGRVLVAAMADAQPSPPDMVLLASPSGRLIRLLAVGPGGGLEERWAREARAEPILLEMTGESVLIAWLESDGPRIESIATADGSTLWSALPLEPAGVRDGVQRASLLSGFVTPLEGRVLSDQILIAGDDRLVAVAERTGRIVTLDRRSGVEMWRGQSEIQRVFDIALGSGVLVVAGTAPDESDNWKTRLVTMEARTGEVTSSLDEAPGMVRWLRISPERQLIAGMDRGLICVDLSESAVRWMLTEDPTMSSIDAWVFGDDLFLLDQNRSLWRVDVPSGRLIEPELETRGRLIDRTGIQVRAVDGLVSFASGSGLVVYDDGDLVGIDVFDLAGALIPSEPGFEHIAMIDSAPVRSPDGFGSYMLYLLANDSGRLAARYPVRAHAPPESVTLLDGKILISAGEATVVIDAPAGP